MTIERGQPIEERELFETNTDYTPKYERPSVRPRNWRVINSQEAFDAWHELPIKIELVKKGENYKVRYVIPDTDAATAVKATAYVAIEGGNKYKGMIRINPAEKEGRVQVIFEDWTAVDDPSCKLVLSRNQPKKLHFGLIA